jgi:hypothetical protein
MAKMLTYASGAPVQVGDAVLIEHGRTPGTIVEVVETPAQFADLNVSEPGVMVKSAPFGLVYLPVEWLAEDSLEFVARGRESGS